MANLWITAGGGLLLGNGLALLLAPDRFRACQARLERPWPIERFVYHHHRLLGGLILGGALLLLGLLAIYHASAFGLGLKGLSETRLLIQLIRFAELVAAVFCLIIGVFVFFRPSLLKRLEATANQWISPIQATSPSASPLIHRLMALSLITAGLGTITLGLYWGR